jgi:rhodanese-related sulfurtransferase
MTIKNGSLQGRLSACAVEGQGGLGEVGPREVQDMLARGEAILVDVREPDEHARERIPGSRLVPLSRFDPQQAATGLKFGQALVLHCRSGRRSADAARMAASLGEEGLRVVNMSGGIEAWKSAGLAVEVNRAAPKMSVMRQVQLAIGAGVLTGSALAWLVHPGFIALAAFFGAGLVFAGLTGTCGLATVIGKLPWNRGAGGSASCASGSCG